MRPTDFFLDQFGIAGAAEFINVGAGNEAGCLCGTTDQPAADAFGGDAAPRAEPLHGVDEVQHDAVAGGADGMAEADRATIDIELGVVDLSGGAVEAQNLAAKLFVVPGGEAAEHLRRK